jgi:CHAT domain-containing protein/tetratricopeptide (TPR) repeat protein
MARHVVDEPASWASALKDARSERFVVVRVLSTEYLHALMACRTSEPLAEEPYGFIACALLFEMTQTLEPYFQLMQTLEGGDFERLIKEEYFKEEYIAEMMERVASHRRAVIVPVLPPPGLSILIGHAVFGHPMTPGALSPLAVEVCGLVLDGCAAQARSWPAFFLQTLLYKHPRAFWWHGDAIWDFAIEGHPFGPAARNPVTTSLLLVKARARLARGGHLLALDRVDEASADITWALATARWRSRLPALTNHCHTRRYWREEMLAPALTVSADLNERCGRPAMAAERLREARDIFQERFERIGDEHAATEMCRLDERLEGLRRAADGAGTATRVSHMAAWLDTGRGVAQEKIHGVMLAWMRHSLDRGQALAGMQAFKKAKATLSRTIETRVPRTPERQDLMRKAYLCRGAVLLRRRYFEAARRDFEAAERLLVRGTASRNVLDAAELRHLFGLTYLEQHQHNAASREIESAVRLCRHLIEQEQADNVQSAARDLLAKALLSLGTLAYEAWAPGDGARLQVAAERFRAAIALFESPAPAAFDPASLADAKARLGKVLARQGLPHEAGNEFAAAVETYHRCVENGRSELLASRAGTIIDAGLLLWRWAPEQAEQEVDEAAAFLINLLPRDFEGAYDPALVAAMVALGVRDLSRGSFNQAAVFFEGAVTRALYGLIGSESELERQLHRARHARPIDSLVFVLCRQSQSGAPSPRFARQHPFATWAERAAYWLELSRARNLADLIQERQHQPRNARGGEIEAYLENGHFVRDLDHRLHLLEAEYLGLPSGGPQAVDCETRIRALRHERSLALLRRHELSKLFWDLDPKWNPAAQPMPASQMVLAARASQAAIVNLRVTQYGTAVVAIAPSGSVHACVIGSFDHGHLSRLAAWRAYLALKEAPPLTRLYEDREHQWEAAVENDLWALGTGLWRPLREWLCGVLAVSPSPQLPFDIILLPGPGLLTHPLHAARWMEDGRERRACDDFRIAYAPGIAALNRCLAGAKGTRKDVSLLAVRNPTAHLDGRALPWSEYEVDQVCRLFSQSVVLGYPGDPGRDAATSEAIREELPRHAVVLMATHGLYHPDRHWTESGIFTAESDGTASPNMTLKDFFDTDLSRVRLLILTACETALVDTADASSEQLGLPTAILAAGATAVIGSLWQVDDVATALLVARFMALAFPPSGGGAPLSAIAALHDAQKWLRSLSQTETMCLLDTIERDLAVPISAHAGLDQIHVRRARKKVLTRGDRPFSHATYWAAFAAYGHVGGIVRGENSLGSVDGRA